MNINRVYECSIHVLVKSFIENGKEMCLSHFVKRTLVYHTNSDDWVDLFTNEHYKLGADVFNDLFITRREPIVPLSTLIDSKRSNMPKRKILKKYKEKNGGKNEKSI